MGSLPVWKGATMTTIRIENNLWSLEHCPVLCIVHFAAPFAQKCDHLPRPPPPTHCVACVALCDIHVAGCGGHLPAWSLRGDRIPGTDQAVRGGRHGQKLHSGFPPRQVDARGSADARISTDACLS